MTTSRLLALTLFCAVVVPSTALADDFALVGGRVLPVDGEPIDRATVVVRDGRITAVGASVTVPDGVRRIDCAGLTITPGLIDADSMLALEMADRTGSRISADQRAAPAFDPWHPHVRTARAQGVTAVFVTGNSRDLNGGAAAVLALGVGSTTALGEVEPLVFNVSTASASGGAWGAGRVHGFDGIFRGLTAASEAQERYDRDLAEYAEKAEVTEPTDEERLLLPESVLRDLDRMTPAQRVAWREAAYKSMGLPKRYTKPKTSPSAPRAPRSSTAQDELLLTIDPDVRRPVVVRAELAEDVAGVLDVIEERELRATLVGGVGLLEHANRIKSAGHPIVVSHLLDGQHLTAGPLHERPTGWIAALVEAGLEPALASGDVAGGTRFLRFAAAEAIGEGLAPDAALRSVTLWAARATGVEAETGSITVGKRADLVVWSGDPFAATTEVLHVSVGGELRSGGADRD